MQELDQADVHALRARDSPQRGCRVTLLQVRSTLPVVFVDFGSHYGPNLLELLLGERIRGVACDNGDLTLRGVGWRVCELERLRIA